MIEMVEYDNEDKEEAQSEKSNSSVKEEEIHSASPQANIKNKMAFLKALSDDGVYQRFVKELDRKILIIFFKFLFKLCILIRWSIVVQRRY